ncbi:GNAT family N-acetyltransferase [Paraburkholderia phenazinium]|uniref:Acetyltransferase (GNAT) domain-containing protein n=1 Tax=Paraburkholderia phenazinium TaxID=60549 RepID=A0A1G8ICA4_9BURK|nr:GNAT family N-acetyltransferase [Paraburkholderia phenazinium]SDI16190.1 Acetyltransferase (GNAT) domain-containing protein [Paraburkholderia phenazinium]
MKIEDIQASDASSLEPMMLHTIRTSVRVDEVEMVAVVANVLANMRWAFDHAQQCVHLKCVDEGRIVGVVLVKNFWNLCSLFVDPDYHRRGLGRRLIEAAVEQCAPRNERSYLQVNAAPNAVAFYRSLGFAKLEGAKGFGTSTPMALPLSAQ